MTDLSPPQPLTHARVLRVALPIVLSGATVPLIGAVDTAVVSQTGAVAPTGAVGIGAVILSTIFWVFGFLRMGTTGMVGQADGAGDTAEVSALLTRALMIGFAAGAALIVLQVPIFRGAFALSPASPEVEALASEYIGIRIWSAPAAIALYAVTGWLIAMERTGAVLVLQLVMNAINGGLDLWFVLGLDMGVAGVAWATVIAEITGCALGLWLCRAAFQNLAWRDWPRVFDRVILIKMALINTDILIRSAALMAIFTSFMFFGAWFGDVTLAANQVLMQFLTVSAFALDGFAFAAEALVARAVGRRDVARLRRASLLAGFWGCVSAVLMAVLFWAIGPTVIDIMHKGPVVQEEARAYLVWVALSPLLGVFAFTLDGVFLGATRGADIRNMMILSLLIYLVAVWTLVPSLGNHGLWIALQVSFAARAATLWARYPALERAVKAGV